MNYDICTLSKSQVTTLEDDVEDINVLLDMGSEFTFSWSSFICIWKGILCQGKYDSSIGVGSGVAKSHESGIIQLLI